MKIIHICPESWGANTYLLISSGEAFVVDPSPSAQTIINQAEGTRIKAIILTHGHFDHVISAERLHQLIGAPVMIHELDNEMLPDPEKNAYRTIFGSDRSFRQADSLLHDGDILPLGDETIKVLHTPGHTKGSICLLAGNILITGDTLFADNFGRIDLFGGSFNDMKHSLVFLSTLDPNLTIYPGHGESSSLGKAISHMRFLQR